MIAINGDAPDTPNNDLAIPRDEGYDEREHNQLLIHNVESELLDQSTLGNEALSENFDSEIDKNIRTTNLEETKLLLRYVYRDVACNLKKNSDQQQVRLVVDQ